MDLGRMEGWGVLLFLPVLVLVLVLLILILRMIF